MVYRRFIHLHSVHRSRGSQNNEKLLFHNKAPRPLQNADDVRSDAIVYGLSTDRYPKTPCPKISHPKVPQGGVQSVHSNFGRPLIYSHISV